MHEQQEHLQEELNAVQTTDLDYNNLAELLYTASETHLLDESVSCYDAMLIYKIVKLASLYGKKHIPEHLRM